MNKDTVARWNDHPLTRYVRGGNPDMPLVDQLFEQLRLMNELEDIFPGLSFEEIFADTKTCPRPTASEIRRGLRASGIGETTVMELAPRRDSRREGPLGPSRGPHAARYANYEHTAALAREAKVHGWHRGELMAHHSVSRNFADKVIALLRDLTVEQWELGLRALGDEPWRTIADEVGLGYETVRLLGMTVKFQLEEAA